MKDFVRIHKRAILLGLAALLVVAASIGGTLAWLTSTPPVLTNSFVPGEVPNEITETFDGNTKSNVQIKNVGNVNAFIRVALVPSWRNDDTGHTGTGLVATGTYNITLNTTDWTLGSDGYYYYNSAVQPTGSTCGSRHHLLSQIDWPVRRLHWQSVRAGRNLTIRTGGGHGPNHRYRAGSFPDCS